MEHTHKACVACGAEFKRSATNYTVKCPACRGRALPKSSTKYTAVACSYCGTSYTSLKCPKCGF